MTEDVKAARTAYAAAIEWQDRVYDETSALEAEYDEAIAAIQSARKELAAAAGDRCPNCGGPPALKDPSDAWSPWGHCVVMEPGKEGTE